jgi:hypothetical protein
MKEIETTLNALYQKSKAFRLREMIKDSAAAARLESISSLHRWME